MTRVVLAGVVIAAGLAVALGPPHPAAAATAGGLSLLAAVPVFFADRLGRNRGGGAVIVGYAVGLTARAAVMLGGGLLVIGPAGSEIEWVWLAAGYLAGLAAETAALVRLDIPDRGANHGGRNDDRGR